MYEVTLDTSQSSISYVCQVISYLPLDLLMFRLLNPQWDNEVEQRRKISILAQTQLTKFILLFRNSMD